MLCPGKCRGYRYGRTAGIEDCKAYIPRFFYDWETQDCHFFAYGGCANVFNMFLSRIECLRECAGITGPVDDTRAADNVHEGSGADIDILSESSVDETLVSDSKIIDELVGEYTRTIVDSLEEGSGDRVDVTQSDLPPLVAAGPVDA